MTQSTYTSVTNAEIVPCGKKGCVINSEPIPLLRNNYLSEYRTELEKAKVRKNLGIADNQSLTWGSIEGHLEHQRDLVSYMENKWLYVYEEGIDSIEQIKTILDAVNYSIKFIREYDANTEAIELLTLDLIGLNLELSTLLTEIEQDFTSVLNQFESISNLIVQINQDISEINQKIIDIDVDKNILAWITEHTKDSLTITYREDSSTLEVILSEKDNNALELVSETVDETAIVYPGLYVENLKPDLELLSETVTTLNLDHNKLKDKVDLNAESLTILDKYQTELSNLTTSPVISGKTVGDLKNLTFSEIIDNLVFPASVRELQYPEVVYDLSSNLVKVGTTVILPTLSFIQGDAGEIISTTETLTYNNSVISEIPQTYNQLGTYLYTGTIEYEEGDKLLNNRGEVSDIYVPAGSISTTVTITTTYPFYYGQVNLVSESSILIPFNQDSGELEIYMGGKALLWIPGINSQLTKFIADAGVGFTDVDITGWTITQVPRNGITYLVYTKNDTYPTILTHKINFILSL